MDPQPFGKMELTTWLPSTRDLLSKVPHKLESCRQGDCTDIGP